MAQAHKNLDAELSAHEKRWQISNQSCTEINGNANRRRSAGITHPRDRYMSIKKTFLQNRKEMTWFQYGYTYMRVFIKKMMEYHITITLFSIAALPRQTVSMWDADPSSHHERYSYPMRNKAHNGVTPGLGKMKKRASGTRLPILAVYLCM